MWSDYCFLLWVIYTLHTLLHITGGLQSDNTVEVWRSAILHYTVNQRRHWACQLYGHTGGTREWLGVERWQLCLQDTSLSAKCHRRAAVGHWVSLFVCSVVGWLIVYQLGILSLSCSQYSLTICWPRWDDNAYLWVRNTNSIRDWPNSHDRRPPWYCTVSPLLQTNKPIPGFGHSTYLYQYQRICKMYMLGYAILYSGWCC